RERLRDQVAAEEQIGAEQAVLAQLVRLTDRARAEPELVRVGLMARSENDRGEDAHPAHARRRYHRVRVTVTSPTSICAPSPAAARPQAPRAGAARSHVALVAPVVASVARWPVI